MRILLTGASGLIGSAVFSRLFAHEVIRLGRDRSSCDYLADLSDLNNCQPFPSCDALVHCAGVVDEDFVDGSLGNLTKVLASAEGLARRAREAGARYAVYISSSHVYGKQEGRVDESCPPNPLSYYAMAHFCTEQIFKKIFSAEDCRVAVLRPNAVYGPLMDLPRFRRWSLIPFSFPLEAYLRGQITLRSSGEQMRNFVSSNTIAETVRSQLDAPLQMPAALNVIGGTTESVYSFAQRCARRFSWIEGRSCNIARPSFESSLGCSPPFRYDSRFASSAESHCLDEHLDQLFLRFKENSDCLKELAGRLS